MMYRQKMQSLYEEMMKTHENENYVVVIFVLHALYDSLVLKRLIVSS